MSAQFAALVQTPVAVANSSGRQLVQRACACGNKTGSGKQCGACAGKDRDVQRKALNSGSRFVADLSLTPVRRQFKLIVSNPGDPLELEADRIADRVMNSERTPKAVAAASAGSVQRQAEAAAANPEGEEESLEDEEESEPGEASEQEITGDESGRPKLAPDADTRPRKQHIAIPGGGGYPLRSGVRDFMESRLGHDLSNVRVHTDLEAMRSADELDAHAYTVGRDIYFNEGRYNPDAAEGRRLLAHELTHVLQQSGGAPAAVQREPRRRRRPSGPRDAPRGLGQRRRRRPPCGPATCGGECTQAVNAVIHHPNCHNETCGSGSAANSSNFIRHLDVNLSSQWVNAEMGTRARTTSSAARFLSSPNPSTTPPGMHRIGEKCGPCHTNMDAHGMAWFTGFVGLEFGFHNSQRVASGVHSLGCVRVPCEKAKWIHDNTESGVTTVCVHTGGHCGRGGGRVRRRRSGSTGGRGGSTPPSQAPPAPLVSEGETDGADEGMVAGEMESQEEEMA